MNSAPAILSESMLLSNTLKETFGCAQSVSLVARRIKQAMLVI